MVQSWQPVSYVGATLTLNIVPTVSLNCSCCCCCSNCRLLASCSNCQLLASRISYGNRYCWDELVAVELPWSSCRYYTVINLLVFWVNSLTNATTRRMGAQVIQMTITRVKVKINEMLSRNVWLTPLITTYHNRTTLTARESRVKPCCREKLVILSHAQRYYIPDEQRLESFVFNESLTHHELVDWTGCSVDAHTHVHHGLITLY